MGSTVSLGCATFFAVASLVLIALSFGTDNWVNQKVVWQRDVPDDLTTAKLYYSRYHGLFRECIVSTINATFLRHPNMRSSVVDGRCLRIEYEIPEKDGHDRYSDNYWAMIHLSRSVVAFFIVSMLFLLTGFIFGSVACWRTTSKPTQVAGIFVFVGAFFAAGAMAFWHGAEYIEKNKLSRVDPVDPVFYYRFWTEELRLATTRTYGWSYIVGWVGVGLSILAAILYLFTAWYIGDKKREDELYERYNTRTRQRPVVYYDYVDQPGALQASNEDIVYVVNNGSGTLKSQPGPAYVGPLEYDRATGTLYKTTGPNSTSTWDYRY